MTPAATTAALLVLIVLFASARLVWNERQLRPPSRPWRPAALLLGQAGGAVLLYLTMFPPGLGDGSAVLTVITDGADAAQLQRVAARHPAVALPEAPEVDGIDRAADLATALRRFPGTRRIEVVGGGLPLRDLDVAGALSVAFDAAPLPRGIVELWYPQRTPGGKAWRIAGRANGVPGGTVELLDPARRPLLRKDLQADGRFVLEAVARTPGRTTYVLQLRDAGGQLVEQLDLPVQTVGGTTLRVLLLSGAPGPELKYLRRWAVDAGLQLGSDIALRPGARILRSATPLTADSLSRLDIVILDERAWHALTEAERSAMTEALRHGLGILLRLTGPPDDALHEDLRKLGFSLRPAELPQATALDGIPIALTRRPLRIEAADGVPLLRDSAGEPLALWRAEGRGRMALWWLSDSFRIGLDGAPGAYGSLWAGALATVARPSAVRVPRFPGIGARADRRQVICNLESDASVTAPDGKRSLLLRDRSGCAGYWPESGGWHVLSVADSQWPFYVRSHGEARALLASELRSATLGIEAERIADPDMQASAPVPGSPWPYFLVFLLVSGATWWLERSGVGRMGGG
jgi:hypothetical protein